MENVNPSLASLTHRLIDLAQKSGADAADAIALNGTSVSIDVRQGTLEQAERSEGTDIGLRVFVGKRQAIVSGSDTSEQTLNSMIERAIAMAKDAPVDEFAGLADPAQITKNYDVTSLELFDPAPEPSAQILEQHAIDAESAALAIKGITQVQSASAGYGQTDVHMAASNGFSAGYRRSSKSISCVAIAGQGAQMERDYDGDTRIFQSDLRSAHDIGMAAGKRAVERLNPTRPPTGQYPILFDERISSSLIGHLLAAANGGAIARGSSWLMDQLGAEILPKGMSLQELPNRARVGGSRAYDAEGLATQDREIVKDGVLTGWTLDLANARKLNMASTANAARGVGSTPSPANWNVTLTQGTLGRDALMRDMGCGLLVTSMIGSTINPNTGDYSRGASGFWIENGEITGAVSEVTIAGNLKDMLRTIIAANDARTHLSRVVPSLLVEGMTLAGS